MRIVWIGTPDNASEISAATGEPLPWTITIAPQTINNPRLLPRLNDPKANPPPALAQGPSPPLRAR